MAFRVVVGEALSVCGISRKHPTSFPNRAGLELHGKRGITSTVGREERGRQDLPPSVQTAGVRETWQYMPLGSSSSLALAGATKG